MLTREQIASYAEDGFIELPNTYTEDDARRFALAMLYLAKAHDCPGLRLPEFSHFPLKELVPILLDSLMHLERTDHIYISRIYDTIRETPELKRMLMKPPLQDAVLDLLALPPSSPLYLQQTSCRIDTPL